MHETIIGLLAAYGYLFVFLFVGLESLEIPLPGETVLVTASAFAARGHLAIAGVIGTAAAAAILGDNGGYWIGHAGGAALVRRHGHLFRLDEAKLERVHGFFERHGAKTVFIGRFVALLRTWAAVFAGAGRMPYGEFMLYNALGGVVWAVIFGVLGYLFGRNLPALEHYIGQASLAFVLLAALVVVVVLLAKRFDLSGAALWNGASRAWGACCGTGVARRLSERYPHAWGFVVARFTPGEFLGLHLTVGLLVSLAGLWLFGGITEDVVRHEPLTAFDTALLVAIRAHATPLGDRIFVLVSLIGSPVAMAVVALAGAAWLAWRRDWLVLGGWGAAFGGAAVLANALKQVIHRPRPTGAAAFLHGASFSFPSGHALGALVGYGMLAYLLVTLGVSGARRHGPRVAVITVTAVLVVVIGVSRLYLGVHYFSDVVGGFAAGVLWLSACISGIEVARRHRQEAAARV